MGTKPKKFQKRLSAYKGLLNLGESEAMTLTRTAEVECIVHLIYESIEKLKISLLLPHIFENPIMLSNHINDTEYKDAKRLVENYIRAKKTEKKPHTRNPHLDYHLIRVIDHFHLNYKILEFLPNWLDDLTERDKTLIEAFKLLQRIAEDRLKKSAIGELLKEKQAHETFYENASLQKSIKDLTEKLGSQRRVLQWKLSGRGVVVQKFQEEISFRKYDYQIKIKQHIYKSRRNIRQINTSSIVRQKELQDELAQVESVYDQTLTANLKQEKIAKDEKNKLLIQLQSLIKKYYQTIGEKTTENENLQKEYDRQKELFDEFMIEYNREEEEYNKLVRVKEEEEKRIQEGKIMLFMMNRAARIIQKAWRRYRKSKRKQRGKKGKRKA